MFTAPAGADEGASGSGRHATPVPLLQWREIPGAGTRREIALAVPLWVLDQQRTGGCRQLGLADCPRQSAGRYLCRRHQTDRVGAGAAA